MPAGSILFAVLALIALPTAFADEAPGTIHGVAIMTESNNTDGFAAARYGSIHFRPDE